MTQSITFTDVTPEHEAAAVAFLDKHGIDHHNAEDDIQEKLDDLVHSSAEVVASKAANNPEGDAADEDFYDAASTVASDTNNLGALGQVSWLLAQGHSVTEVATALEIETESPEL